MRKELFFASANKNKIDEIQQKLGTGFEIKGLDFFGIKDIEENGKTIEENSRIKAAYLHNKYNVNCFADDSGLEVEYLNGAPGVHSARYSGAHRNDLLNMEKLLTELKGVNNRNARFKTVITLFYGQQELVFEGIINGVITTELRGVGGFGYDPIFMPAGYNKTFAEMTLKEKNLISHRAIAIEKMITFLNKQH